MTDTNEAAKAKWCVPSEEDVLVAIRPTILANAEKGAAEVFGLCVRALRGRGNPSEVLALVRRELAELAKDPTP